MGRIAVAAALLVASAGAAEARITIGPESHVIVAPRERQESPPPVAPGPRGELVVVPGSSPASAGDALRFAVEVEGGLPVDRAAFARRVTRILNDRRSWGRPMQRVDSGAFDFRVSLARPALTDQLCAPLLTNGIFSCAQGGRAVLNASRWLEGASAYGGRLRSYRTYMVNHEVGHLLGLGHVGCPGAGAPAPVMMQQTKGVAPCLANPWPLAWERS